MAIQSNLPPPTTGSGQRPDLSQAQSDKYAFPTKEDSSNPTANALIRRTSGASTGDAKADLQKLHDDYKNNVEGTARDAMAAFQNHEITWGQVQYANSQAMLSWKMNEISVLNGASNAEKEDLKAAAAQLWPEGDPSPSLHKSRKSDDVREDSGPVDGHTNFSDAAAVLLSVDARDEQKGLPDVVDALPYTKP